MKINNLVIASLVGLVAGAGAAPDVVHHKGYNVPVPLSGGYQRFDNDRPATVGHKSKRAFTTVSTRHRAYMPERSFKREEDRRRRQIGMGYLTEANGGPCIAEPDFGPEGLTSEVFNPEHWGVGHT